MSDLAALKPRLEGVEIAMRAEISKPNVPLEHAYFPVSGLFSAIAIGEPEDQVEMGLIGREGFLGASILLLAQQDPFRVIVQASGRALRLPADEFLEESSARPAFRAVLLRYIHTFMVQAASTILANASYTLDERLARWILMTQDRLDTASLPLTHQFLSLMLAVRRASVTETIHRLESLKLIQADRGQVQVLDRAGLEALAAGSYGQAEREYRRLINADLKA